MAVWCPLLPPDTLDKIEGNAAELRRINSAFEDWCISMRVKPSIGVEIGILLDRIRMLLINVGIACAQNRTLAESVQSVISERLRKNALGIVERIPREPPAKGAVRATLSKFFNQLRFNRDIIPEDEMREAYSSSGSMGAKADILKQFGLSGLLKGFRKKKPEAKPKSQGGGRNTVRESLAVGTAVVKELYLRLLSPDPWGSE
jgi:hypothetical protein